MIKKRKKKPAKRDRYSPLMRLELNQMVKSTEAKLSGDELKAFRNLSQADSEASC